MSVLARLAVIAIAVVFVIFGPLIDCLGGLSGDGTAGPTPWRVAKITAGALLILLTLTACAGTPLGTHVERKPGAVVVNSWTFGLVAGCGLVGLGIQLCHQIRIDPDCGVAVIENPDPARRRTLARIATEVRAGCERGTTQEEKK